MDINQNFELKIEVDKKIQTIQKLNPNIRILSYNDFEFKEYGRIYKNFDISQYANFFSQEKISEGISYYPSIPELELLSVTKYIQNIIFGEIPIQVGLCKGFNTSLNALEYHKTSEVVIAITDLMLLLGKARHIETDYYDITNIKLFFFPKHAIIELYPFTLHFAPVQTDENGFIAAIILPNSTNLPLINKSDNQENGNDKYLFAKNKWLLAYPESKHAAMGASVALKGEKISIVLK